MRIALLLGFFALVAFAVALKVDAHVGDRMPVMEQEMSAPAPSEISLPCTTISIWRVRRGIPRPFSVTAIRWR